MNRSKWKYAVIDIETTGLDRYKHQINYIGIGLARDIGMPLEKTYIFNMHENKDIKKFLNIYRKLREYKIKCIWQNGKFDTLWMEHHYDIKLPISHDVMVMGTAYALRDSHSLDDMALKYLGIQSWDIPLREKIKPNNPVVEAYLELDLLVPWKLFNYFVNAMDDNQMKIYRKLLLPAYKMYRKVERRGIYFDRKQYKKVKKEYAIKAEEKKEIIDAQYPINWNSPPQVAAALFGTDRKSAGLPVLKKSNKTGAPSADAATLKRLAAMGYKIAQQIQDYKFYYGANSKFLNKWGDFASYDGRIHPSFGLTNVLTGRTSCSNPNLQQVPRRKELRTLYTAGPGRKLIEADYSQIELRVAADEADETTMLNIYRNNGDIHSETGSLIAGKPVDKLGKDDRRNAKAVNFGFLYGMLAKKFKDYAYDSYDVVLTDAEARRFRELFFQKYNRLLPWHEEVAERCEALGGVYNKFGRFLALPKIYSDNRWERLEAIRQAINGPVQSTASDLLLCAAIEIDQTLSSEGVWIVGTVHDAILADVPEDMAEDACKEIQRIMSHPRLMDEFGVEFKIPISADVGIGAWGAK